SSASTLTSSIPRKSFPGKRYLVSGGVASQPGRQSATRMGRQPRDLLGNSALVRVVFDRTEIDLDVQACTVEAGGEQRDGDAHVARRRWIAVSADDRRCRQALR